MNMNTKRFYFLYENNVNFHLNTWISGPELYKLIVSSQKFRQKRMKIFVNFITWSIRFNESIPWFEIEDRERGKNFFQWIFTSRTPIDWLNIIIRIWLLFLSIHKRFNEAIELWPISLLTNRLKSIYWLWTLGIVSFTYSQKWIRSRKFAVLESRTSNINSIGISI